jgi:hypothetical protein
MSWNTFSSSKKILRPSYRMEMNTISVFYLLFSLCTGFALVSAPSHKENKYSIIYSEKKEKKNELQEYDKIIRNNFKKKSMQIIE